MLDNKAGFPKEKVGIKEIPLFVIEILPLKCLFDKTEFVS
jgi:hypothetical protein